MSIIRMREEEDRISQTKYNSNLALALSAVRITLYFASFFFCICHFVSAPRMLALFRQNEKKKNNNKSMQMFIYGQAVLACIINILSAVLFCFGFFLGGFGLKMPQTTLGKYK